VKIMQRKVRPPKPDKRAASKDQSFVSRFLNPLFGLRSKLTLSYALVTVAALVVVELVVVVGLSAIVGSGLMSRIMAHGLAEAVVPSVEPYLARTPPDLEGLQKDLGMISAEPPARGAEDVPGSTFEETLTGFTPLGTTLFVLDPDRRLLGGYPAVSSSSVGKGFDIRGSPELDALVTAALNGEEDPGQLNEYTTPDAGLLAVAPVKGEDGRVLGVVGAAIRLPNIAAPLVIGLALSAIPLLLAAGFVSAVFGFWTARGLSRRLQRLATTTENWGRGDFSVAAGDRSRDELGRLSKGLNHMAGELEALIRTRQVLATLEARNRFARDLHDSVKQQVFATSLQVDTARTLLKDGAEADTYLARANEILEGAQKELDVLIHEMRPAALEEKGLADALRDYAAGWSRGSGVPVEVRVQGEREVSLEVEQALFRVAQEALANVAKHSGAGHAGVDLIYGEDAVRLRITDDGRGFDPAEASGEGFGLQSMSDRLAGIGGRVDIESAPGEGTTVTCVCPAGEPSRER
jgi:two-component system, NarL family, sensor histidine kinase LiaS